MNMNMNMNMDMNMNMNMQQFLNDVGISDLANIVMSSRWLSLFFRSRLTADCLLPLDGLDEGHGEVHGLVVHQHDVKSLLI